MEEIKLVAFFMSMGVPVKELEGYLGASAATIARRVEEARSRGYLQTRLEYDSVRITAEDVARFKLYPLQRRLAETLGSRIGGGWVPQITIVPNMDTDTGWDLINRVGRTAAVRLVQHVQAGRMRKCGVAYGGSVAAVARGASQLALTRGTPISTSCEFIPVCGDLLQPEEPEAYSLAASSLAAELAKAFGGRIPSEQRFLWSPSYISWEFLRRCPERKRESVRKLIVKFVESLPSHQEILGYRDEDARQKEQRLIRQVDTLITGVGDIASLAEEAEGHRWFRVTQHLSPEDKSELRDRSVGDICGQHIARRGLSNKVAASWEEEQRWLDERMNRIVLGPSRIDLAVCAARAHTNGTPGVFIVAAEARKAEIVATVALLDLATELIIDAALANAIAELLEIEH